MLCACLLLIQIKSVNCCSFVVSRKQAEANFAVPAVPAVVQVMLFCVASFRWCQLFACAVLF
jgi:hypothetical protein